MMLQPVGLTTGTTRSFRICLRYQLICTHANSASEPCIGYASLAARSHLSQSCRHFSHGRRSGDCRWVAILSVERRVRERPGMFSRPPDVNRDSRRADLINRARVLSARMVGTTTGGLVVGRGGGCGGSPPFRASDSRLIALQVVKHPDAMGCERTSVPITFADRQDEHVPSLVELR